MPPLINRTDLHRFIMESPLIRAGGDRVEVRSLSIFAMSVAFYMAAESAVYIGFIEQSAMHKVAMLSGYPIVSLGFFVTAALMLPHLLALVFTPSRLSCRLPRELAGAGAFLGAVLWASMALLSQPLDFTYVTPLYIARAIFGLWVAWNLALSLNAQLAREEVGTQPGQGDGQSPHEPA